MVSEGWATGVSAMGIRRCEGRARDCGSRALLYALRDTPMTSSTHQLLLHIISHLCSGQPARTAPEQAARTGRTLQGCAAPQPARASILFLAFVRSAVGQLGRASAAKWSLA